MQNIFSFIKKRFSREERFGLTLTLGVVIATSFAFLFLNIWEAVRSYGSKIWFDQEMFEWIPTIRTPFLTKIMVLFTYLGAREVVLALILLSAVFLWKTERRRRMFFLLFSAGIGEFLVVALKYLIGRQRPPVQAALIDADGFSFPSGHSFIAVSFYGVLTYFLFRHVKKKNHKAAVLLIGLTLVTLIGFSRIYLGVHWTSDVLGSFAASLVLVTVLITVYEIQKKI